MSVHQISTCLTRVLLLGLASWAPAQVTIRMGPEIPGAVLHPLLGVNAGPTPAGEPGNPDLTAAYQEIGVTMVRTHDFYGPLDMPVMFPDQDADPALPSSYDFAASDRIYRAILEGGFEPYLRLGDSWNNVRRVTNRPNWVRAAVEVVRHYNDAGLWGRSPLRFVEIYNEPDSAHFWKGTREEFFELFVDTAQALKQAFPELKIGGPGFAPTGFLAPKGMAMSRGLVEFCRARNAPLDFLSFHVYSNDPSDYAQAAAYYRGLLEANGYPSAQLHITEWNTSSLERGDPDPDLRVGSRGAAINTAAWILLEELGVTVSTFYRGNDTSLRLPTFYGLFFADGRPKAVAQAFRWWAEIARRPRRVQVSLLGTSELRVLAASNGAGDMAILIANPSPTPVSWRVEGVGVPPGSRARMDELTPGPASATSVSLSRLEADISGHSVQFVVLTGPPA